jgi:hypothetical protein
MMPISGGRTGSGANLRSNPRNLSEGKIAVCMQVFSSVTANYIPKARVLAASLKKFHPEATFHLVVSDAIPAELRTAPAPFDSVIHIEELPIANVRQWIFKHTRVELCTAVKGIVCQKIMAEHPGEVVFYFDPDMVILAPLADLMQALTQHDVLVTPHQTEPESSLSDVEANEVSSLRHGTFNLGFLGLAPTAEARRFVDWWSARLQAYCVADIENGLFTDQRWVDLAPAFFPTLGVYRDPGCNVATWNLSSRVVSGEVPYQLLVNGRPLCCFHFSGFDSGRQKRMLDQFGGHSPVLYALRDWYIEQCRQMGQEPLGNTPWAYACFDNGVPITDDHRRLYRMQEDIQRAFPNPAATADSQQSYYHWYFREITDEPVPGTSVELRGEVLRLRRLVSFLTPNGRALADVLGESNRLGRELYQLQHANRHYAELNTTVMSANASVISDNKTMATAIDEVNAVNRSLVAANQEFTAMNQALIASQAAVTEANRLLSETNRALTDKATNLQQRARHFQEELERLQHTRSYRLAHKVSVICLRLRQCSPFGAFSPARTL